jgi:hypothetical protein
MSKSVKVKLPEEFLPDFHILCISSSLNDYRICWSINNVLSLQLSKVTEYIPFKPEPTNQRFSVYSNISGLDFFKYFLISNKSEHVSLVNNLSDFDYFFCVVGKMNPQDESKLISTLQTIENVILVAKADSLLLKPPSLKVIDEIIESIE